MDTFTLILFAGLLLVSVISIFLAYRQGYKKALRELDEWTAKVQKQLEEVKEFLVRLP